MQPSFNILCKNAYFVTGQLYQALKYNVKICPERSHFEHFRGPAAELPPEALRNVILTIFKPWPPDGPRRSQRAHFEHFRASATGLPQEAPRIVNLTIFKPWPPDGPRHPQRDHFFAFSYIGHRIAQGGHLPSLEIQHKMSFATRP